MKKGFILLCLLVAAVSGWQLLRSSQKISLPLVVITQIIDHDALDHERQGIVTAMADAGFVEGKTVALLYKSAQGNITTAQQIANDFASRKPAVAVGISTPSAQSLMRTMEKYHVPIVFSAVTDPVEAKLVGHLSAPRLENITGVSDGVPVKAQLELIQQFIPHIKKMGVLYNPGENNSLKVVERLRVEAAQENIDLIFAATSKTSETISAAQNLVTRVQAIFIPNDNTVMASLASVAALASEHRIPLFNPDFDAVEKGILATRACSHFAMGYKAGKMVVKILQGIKASDIAVEISHPLELAINKTVARHLGIKISGDMEKTAKLII